MTRRIELDLDRRVRPERAVVRARLAAQADPLTGHRGASAETVVASMGPATLLLRLSRDERGPVLRGQAIAEAVAGVVAPPPGGLVHARGSAGVALAALDENGEFVARGWDGDLVAVDLELEEGAWRLAWSGGEGAP